MRKIVSIGPYINFFKLQFIRRHNLSYLEFGDINNPNVIFCVHGLARNAHDFHDIAKYLSKDFRVISLDLPGRGHSDWFKNKAHYNYYTYIKDIILLLKKLDIKSVYWMGSSMGGIIGMALSTYYPKLIKSLVINDVGPELPKSTVSRIEKYVNLDPTFDSFSDAKKHVKKIFRNFGIRDEKTWTHITQNSMRLCSDNKYRLSYDPNIMEGTSAKKTASRRDSADFINLWYLWEKIKCPIMVIHGKESDILLDSTIKKMYNYQEFELYEIENAGHVPALVYKKDMDVIYKWFLDKKSC